jgi:uncharacterized membrane protein
MQKERLAAFSDGVLAIIITIMVLELKVPHGADLSALIPLLSVFLSYVLSFIYIAIYWHNHHHMLHLVHQVNGSVLWANTHLLFWLSLVPFTTGWMGENHFATIPTALYGVSLLMPGIAYFVLARVIIYWQGPQSTLAAALGRDLKGKASPILYCFGIALSFVHPWLGLAVYGLVALMWLVPDKRIEKALPPGH